MFMSKFNQRPQDKPKPKTVQRRVADQSPKTQPNGLPVRPPSSKLSRPGDISHPKPVHRPKPTKAPVAAVRNTHKRKSASPAIDRVSRLSSDDDDSESDNELERRMRVKQKSSPDSNGVDESAQQPRQRLVHTSCPHGPDAHKLLHAADFVDSSPDEYDSVFPSGELVEVALQYPNMSQKERFKIVKPKKSDGYRPLEDILETIKSIRDFYIQDEALKERLDDYSGIPWRLNNAFKRADAADLRAAIDDFNSLMVEAHQNGKLARTLELSEKADFALIRRILDQITVRIVSPKSESLRKYESFSSEVYGEMLPPFSSQIFKDTKIDSESVFVDLGSGVGNVVLQAALEVGCEAHGIEIMSTPAQLAREQEVEFPARCCLWGLSAGPVELVEGNIEHSTELADWISRADAIVVNNYVFSPKLNGLLKDKFLDAKDGARIVSLKSFVPNDWTLSERNREDVAAGLEVRSKDFWSGYVSWTDKGGVYYIATKDPARIERILSEGNKRRRTR